jgi:cation diffusion facilitator family transporter
MAAGSTRAVVAAMIANAIIAVAKFVASAVTGSSAMLSEGIHSVADTGNQALLLFGNRRSHRPPDRQHPFGYGPELYFWSLIVAMILSSGASSSP